MKFLLRWTLIGATLLVDACSTDSFGSPASPSALDPKGPQAAAITQFWWIMFGLGAAVYLLVIAILLILFTRRQRATSETPPAIEDERGRNWILYGGILMPIIVLGITFGFNIRTLAAVSNPSGVAKVTIDVTGRRWWWEVSYPGKDVETANEVHIPVGVPVEIRVQSGDVIHSFWVPQLHGKMDAIPGQVNTLVLQTDQPGQYRGECAEFCGAQHTHMGLFVVAESQADFDAWLAHQKEPAPAPTGNAVRGQQVFLQSGCSFCHPLRGLDDSAIDASVIDLGPDLTHLQSRLTVAAATLPNNQGSLAGWIVDAQHIKPGALMPPEPIKPDDLNTLLAYLDTLK